MHIDLDIIFKLPFNFEFYFELTAKIIKFYDIYYTELRVLEQSGAAVQTGPLKLLQATRSLHQLQECAPVSVHLHTVLHSVLILSILFLVPLSAADMMPSAHPSMSARGRRANNKLAGRLSHTRGTTEVRVRGFREQGSFYFMLVLPYFKYTLIYYVNFV